MPLVFLICGGGTFGAIGVGLAIDSFITRRGHAMVRRGRVGFWGEADR